MIEWEEVSIGLTCQVIAGQSPDGKFYNDQGIGLPFYQGKKNFGEKFIQPADVWTSDITKEALAGDILMSVRAPVGPINFSTDRVCIGRGLAAIRAGDRVNKDFLFYLLLSKQSEITGNKGAVFDSINKKQIEQISYFLPSVSEQRRIVEILDEAFEGIDAVIANTEKNLANTRELFERFIANIFSSGNTDWVECSIGDVCTLKSGTTVPVEIEKSDGDVPYIKVAEMTMAENLDGISTSIRFLDYQDIKKNWMVPKGATIFPKRGGAILTNKKRMLLRDVCLDLNIMAVIPSDKILSEFLYAYFLSVDMRKLGNGSSIPQINNVDIAPLKFSFPICKVEQQEVIKKFRTVESGYNQLLKTYENKLGLLKELKQSFLQKAFRGELTSGADALTKVAA